MPPEKIDERKAATDLERGSGASLSQLLAGKFEEDRVKTYHRVEAIYKQDAASDSKLKADLTFRTDDFWHNELSVVDNRSGKALYFDSLDLKEMKHTERVTNLTASGSQAKTSERTFAPPPDRQPLDPEVVARVTKDLENGSPDSLVSAQDGKMQEERARFLTAVKAQNQTDLSQKRTAYELQIDVEGFKHHTNEMRVARYAPGAIWTANFWNNPASIYSDTIDMNTGKREILAKRDDRK